jgi:hypothetical protein
MMRGVWNLNSVDNRRDYEGQKGKSININYWWNMGDGIIHLQKVNTLLMIGI